MRERDPINFNFRVVALLTAMITRPDLLDEYQAKHWERLERLGLSCDLLEEMFYLFQLPKVRDALLPMQQLYRTMLAIEFYCPLECPDDEWLTRYVNSTGDIPQELSPAGVEVEA